ncbi:MAG: GNAT family N-acetyltransferase [Nocardioides sp.]|nr:GNAT family N-acetyltransferase [Nocardioides sp.]
MGDDALTPGLVDLVLERFVAVNGDHPMSEADDAYVREHFVPATPDSLPDMMAGRLPLPSYVLSDGTPMVPEAHGELVELAGGVHALHAWFVAFWPDDPATGEGEWSRYLAGRQFCLREVTPVGIRRRNERVAEAAAAVELLRLDPHDPIGRGMLGEAVDGVIAVAGLDSLLLPMTAYDRLRFGGPTVRDTWVDRPRAEFLTPTVPAWPLRTERLELRPFVLADADAFVEAWTSEEWTGLLLSRTQNRSEVVEMVRRCADPGDRKFIALAVTRAGEVVGEAMLRLQGTGLSEGEIGWTVLAQHAGRGYATEAAREMLRLAFEHYGLRRVVANLDARNDRSRALCERLGMRLESDKRGDFWSKGGWTDSYEYALLAEEWRAGRGS